MKSILRALIVILAFLALSGCNNERAVYVISSNPELHLPFKASKFFGFFDKRGIKLHCDTAPDSNSLIRFLNFSKYTVVITDLKTANKLKNYTSRWSSICVVAFKKNENKLNNPRGKFVLLMKDSLLKKHKEAVSIIKGWNYGVELLKDPAVVMLLSPEGKIHLKFLQCGK